MIGAARVIPEQDAVVAPPVPVTFEKLASPVELITMPSITSTLLPLVVSSLLLAADGQRAAAGGLERGRVRAVGDDVPVWPAKLMSALGVVCKLNAVESGRVDVQVAREQDRAVRVVADENARAVGVGDVGHVARRA